MSKAIPSPSAVNGTRLPPSSPLHQLFVRRMERGRDLKVIVTAKNAQTGTGKTTLAFWLAQQWHSMYADEDWTAENHATLDVQDYLDKYREAAAGSVLIMDEAEQLDSRRSMSHDNVDFSHYWMMMRVRQIVSILTLPSTSALDSRLQELADVWIDVERRGKAVVHGLNVNSYNKNTYTPKIQTVKWPNVADHEEMQALDEMKQAKIDRQLKDLTDEEESVDPDDYAREKKIQYAQNARDSGLTIAAISSIVDMSEGWVSNNTEKPE